MSLVFLNLSNHPSVEWSADQRVAALALAEPITDLPFPAMPADADEAAIEQLADEHARRVPSGVSHALVQGEFTLTLGLVQRLQRRGIICLAATSERRTGIAADGRKLSELAFVRFRAYPSPVPPE
jgi:hypothetical protein